MAGFGYSFERYPQRKDEKKRPWRAVLLFVLVAGITGAIIWWLFPHSLTPKNEKNGETTSESIGKSSKSEVPIENSVKPEKIEPANVNALPSQNGEVVLPIPADEKKDVNTIVDTKLNGLDNHDVDETKITPDSGDDNVTPLVNLPEKEEDKPAEPKGKVTSGDLPEEKDKPILPEGNVTSTISSALSVAEKDFSEGKLVAAQTAGYKLLGNCQDNTPDYLQVAAFVTKVNCALSLKGVIAPPCSIVHRIVSGNTLNGIAANYHTGKGMIVRSNRLNSDRILVGNKLTVFPGPWSIRVEKGPRLLKLYQHINGSMRLFALFQVGIGRFGRTPSADFVVSLLERHPTWYAPDGRVYKYGDPNNELGDYFLKLATPGAPLHPLRGYGIHGTRDERTVGRSLSNGCIRMRNQDVELLYLLIPRRTPVKIVE